MIQMSLISYWWDHIICIYIYINRSLNQWLYFLIQCKIILGANRIAFHGDFHTWKYCENHCLRALAAWNSLPQKRWKLSWFFHSHDWVSIIPIWTWKTRFRCKINYSINLNVYYCDSIALQIFWHCVIHSWNQGFRCKSVARFSSPPATQVPVWDTK